MSESPINVPEWARDAMTEAHRLLLATMEQAFMRRAELDAQIARIEAALRWDDASLLREGDVPPEASPE